VIAFKSGLNRTDIVVIIVNLVVGVCLGKLKSTIIGKVIGYILGGIDFYMIFYSLINEVNSISLLLFWTDLWTALFGTYTSIEKCIGGEVEEREVVDFDLQNYLLQNININIRQ
jgi:hypothetical protein